MKGVILNPDNHYPTDVKPNFSRIGINKLEIPPPDCPKLVLIHTERIYI